MHTWVREQLRKLLAFGERCNLGLLALAILPCLEIDRFLALSFRAIDTIEAALALPPRIALGNHALDERQRLIHAMKRIALGQARRHARIHMRHEIEPHHIEQREHARLRMPMGLPIMASASSTVRPNSNAFTHCRLQPIDAEPVRNEARTVVAVNDALSEHHVRKGLDRLDRLARRRRARGPLRAGAYSAAD